MDKDAVLIHILKLKGVSTLLGGDLPVRVINENKYISPLAAEGEVIEENLPTVDQAIRTALTGENKTVTVIGPEGSGKTTALEKLVVDWAKGEHLQNFEYVFHFRFQDLNAHEDVLSIATLIQRCHHYFPPKAMPLVVQKPEDVLFVFDGLNDYKHSLDPAAYTLCSDPDQAVSVPCLLASLLHGSLLNEATFVVATRPTAYLKFLSGSQVKVLGFLKSQRNSYVNSFFTDAPAANKALMHMERTLGFYDFCTSPRFCWTVCSVYKPLTDSGGKLPETLSQLFVDILVHLIQMLSLSQADSRELVLALGRMASHCSTGQHLSCTKAQTYSFGFQPFLTSADTFLRREGELESDTCVFSFHSQLMQEFMLALSFFLDKSIYTGAEKMLEKHKDSTKFLDLFLSGLSEPTQRRPLENLLGEFNCDQIKDFKQWFKSSSEEALQGYNTDSHYRCFHLLHQAQSESLVKEIIIPSARIGISYGNLSLQDCVAWNYIVACLGGTDWLNLYRTSNLTEEMAEILAPAMSLSHKIVLTASFLSTGAVSHLASALNRGLTRELDLSHSHLGDEKFKILCAGLRDCKLQKLHLVTCNLTEASCEDLVSALTSDTSQLCLLEMAFNEIGDQGFEKLCRALHSPHCKLEKLQLDTCELTEASMEVFSAALCSGQSQLKEVDMKRNIMDDSGVEALCKALQHPLCKLQSLNLSMCELTGACCSHLSGALMSEYCSLSELDLSVNELGQEGALLLCQALRRPGCILEKLGLTRCELTLPVFEELGSLLKSGTCQLKSLSVGLNKVGDQGVKHLWDAIAHPGCLLEELDVEMTRLTDACLEDLCTAVRASKTLKRLELRNNSLTDASVPALVQVMQDSHRMQEMNLKYNDFSEDVFDMLDKCKKITY
ncbi:NACHT, LRR and PYD domains-containing protein 14 [Archocentrus centrarchus]|uniref:NACHT, LRR and PYD domains-containing protein 14 n=1 Tax=Archocentrus centrarchus TaxID=63155 RepID=UPI0011EA48C8|nr:NACHT, LRR and PYD domains-containing protein 14-like [Archocentrus centrarchus]